MNGGGGAGRAVDAACWGLQQLDFTPKSSVGAGERCQALELSREINRVEVRLGAAAVTPPPHWLTWLEQVAYLRALQHRVAFASV